MGSGDGSTDGSTFYTLYEDGTYLSTDSFFCSAPDNSNEPSCQGTWSSNNTGITLYSFFPTTYDLNQTNGIWTMTSELKDEMTSYGETTATCSKSIYTQQ